MSYDDLNHSTFLKDTVLKLKYSTQVYSFVY